METEEKPSTGLENQKKAQGTFNFQLVLYAAVLIVVLILCFNIFFMKKTDVSAGVTDKAFSMGNGAQGEAGPGSSR